MFALLFHSLSEYVNPRSQVGPLNPAEASSVMIESSKWVSLDQKLQRATTPNRQEHARRKGHMKTPQLSTE